MIPLEDNFNDILNKAINGLGLDPASTAKAAGITTAQLESLLSGNFDEPAARALAPILKLNPDALVRIARNEYHPEVAPPSLLACVTTPFHDMTVNAYVLWDPDNHDAAIFDTGADAAPILDIIRAKELNVLGIFLTHGHPDHILALKDLQKELAVEAWSSKSEPVEGTRTFLHGDLFNAGCHFIRTRLTPGHTIGGTTFVIEGKRAAAAIVGDALFAGSIGGIRHDYEQSLNTIRREIISLPDNTLICPGHGPITRVALEKANNPFF